MEKAYMIRNDGKYIPITQHIYGSKNIEDIDETLAAAEWLYKNTKNNSTKNLIIDFIVLYGKSLNSDNIISAIIDDINNKPYKFLSENFIKSISDLIEENSKKDINYALNDLNDLVNYELNQEFLRARYGGMYNTSNSSREMVFRISSIGFNWFNIIYEFVYNNRSQIDTVTIVRDEESTGMTNYYYKHGSKVFNKLPIDEFITISGNPVVEDFEKIIYNKNKKLLYCGKSILESFTNINIFRLFNKLLNYNFKETQEFYCRK